MKYGGLPRAAAQARLDQGLISGRRILEKGITDYASLPAGTYNVKVVPAGATEPVVIEADLTLSGGSDYTVMAVNPLASIEPLVLIDDNSAPAAGKAHVRFVHASPDAPAVDVAVKGGPVLFGDVSFKEASSYLPVDAGAYDLEVRLAGTTTMALEAPGVALRSGTTYTIFAMGFAAGTPALTAVAGADATALPATLPRTGEQSSGLPLLAALGLGALAITLSFALRRRLA